MVLTPPTERELLDIWKSALKVGDDFDAWPEEKREMWNENVDDLFDTYNTDFDRMMKRTLNVATLQEKRETHFSIISRKRWILIEPKILLFVVNFPKIRYTFSIRIWPSSGDNPLKKSLSIPAIAALDNDDIELDGALLVEQIEYGTDIQILSGCSVYELIAVLCYCSLRRKGKACGGTNIDCFCTCLRKFNFSF